MSVSVQTVKRTGLYKTFNTSLIQILLRQSVDEIFKCQIFSVQYPLSDQRIRHSLTYSLYSGKSEPDSVLIHTEGSLTAVHIRRQNLDTHIQKTSHIFGQLCRIVTDRSQRCRHKFLRIIVLKISCLI